MRQSIRLGTFYGIAVGVNWSVLLILALFAWELADEVLPTRAGHPNVADWIAGVVGAVVLLASLLAHECSHALVARHNGVGVKSITLFVFGGVAQLQGEAHTPGADFRIAAAGPATSVSLAALFAAAQALAVEVGAHGLVVSLLSWLWEINLLLAAFNLIPAAPLDGGRILRAGLWHHWRDHDRASVAAARAGRGFGVFLIVVGVLAFLYGWITGLWAALIGLFVYSLARAEEQYAIVRGSMAGLRVGQIMIPNPPAVPSRTPVSDLASLLWHYRGDAVAVTDDHGWLSGVVTLNAVKALRADRRHTATLSDIAVPLDAVPVGHADEPVSDLLERIVSAGGTPALVLDADNRLAGIVTLSEVERAASFVVGGRR